MADPIDDVAQPEPTERDREMAAEVCKAMRAALAGELYFDPEEAIAQALAQARADGYEEADALCDAGYAAART